MQNQKRRRKIAMTRNISWWIALKIKRLLYTWNETTKEMLCEWIKHKMHEAASEALALLKKMKIKTFWWKEELLEIIEEKKILYL